MVRGHLALCHGACAMEVPMLVFTCSACGGHSFKVAGDLTEATCASCSQHLGRWRPFRERLKGEIKPAERRKETGNSGPKRYTAGYMI